MKTVYKGADRYNYLNYANNDSNVTAVIDDGDTLTVFTSNSHQEVCTNCNNLKHINGLQKILIEEQKSEMIAMKNYNTHYKAAVTTYKEDIEKLTDERNEWRGSSVSYKKKLQKIAEQDNDTK